MKFRRERDSLGEKDVPADVLYGIHTVRSLENFRAAGQPLPRELILAMVRIKWACALANEELGRLDPRKAQAIVASCQRILDGGYDDQFPVDIFQAGSGTSSHMNVNEVIANLACEVLGGARGDRGLVHPNDDVNRGQSTNNVFPTAIRVAVLLESRGLLEALESLELSLRKQAEAFADVLKAGRTHLQDAVPMTLGMEFGAWAEALRKAGARVKAAREKLLVVGLGGNAVGTGLNTHPLFREKAVARLAELVGEPLRIPDDGVEATQFLTDVAEYSSALKLLAVDMIKVADDLRLLSSGPHTGLGELTLPAVEPGSSMMPGKVNPSICEAVDMACLQVFGYDTAVAAACSRGQLDLNTHMPLIGSDVVQATKILREICRMLDRACVTGITVHKERCSAYCSESAGVATVLVPRLGYDRTAALVRRAVEAGRPVRDVVMEEGILTPAEWDELLRRSLGPG